MGWRARRAVALAARYPVLDVVVVLVVDLDLDFDLDLVLDLVPERPRRGGARLRTAPPAWSSPWGTDGVTPALFQRGRAAGLAATYHLRFTGSEPREATVVIRDGTIRVDPR